MSGKTPGPCDVPDPGHDGEVHFYVTGWRCDAHSPWAQKGLPLPGPQRAPAIYTYRAAPPGPPHPEPTVKISLCKHRHPVQPPHGSTLTPVACTRCGTPWADVQAVLDRQEVLLRLGTAHTGPCTWCHQTRMVFRYVREAQPWTEQTPAVLWLCTRCWSRARQAEEAAGFVDFDDVVRRGTDEQALAALRGAL